MAKKKGKNKTGKNEIDLDDLDNLGLDDDIDIPTGFDEDDRKPNKARVAKEVLKETSKGFLNSALKKTAEKALPEEYTTELSTAREYTDFVKETIGTNKSKIDKSLYNLGKEVRKILPFQSKMLNKFLEKYESDFEAFRQESEEARQESLIQSNLSSIFDKQLEVTKALEARREAREQADKRQNLAITKMNLDTLTSIDNNIAQQTAFTLQITKEYYRKSLELQFKSYFVQADMLKTMRDYYKGFSVQLDDIAKNTGLPEFVKLTKSEAVKEAMRQQALQTTYDQLFSKSKYVENIKKRFSSYIAEKTSLVTDAIDNITNAVSGVKQLGDTGESKLGLIGSTIGVLFGDTVGEKVAKKISDKIGNRLKENKYVKAGASELSTLASSPAAFFQNLREKVSGKASEYENDVSISGTLKNKLFRGLSDILGVTKADEPDTAIKKSSILDHNKPAIFDKNVHRSITEVIPMYLAKILMANQNLTGMYRSVNSEKLKDFKEIKELVYDYEERKLDTLGNVKRRLSASFAKESSTSKINAITSRIAKSAEQIGKKDKTLTDEEKKTLSDKSAQKLFTEYVSKADEKITDKEKFTFKNLTDVNSEYAKEVLSVFNAEERDKLKEYLKVLNKSNVRKYDEYSTKQLEDIKYLYPTEPVVKMFSETFKLAQTKGATKLSKSQAEIISKAFLNYMFRTGNSITIETIVSSKCFGYIDQKEEKEISDIIALFRLSVLRIKQFGGIDKISALSNILAIGSEYLKAGLDNVKPMLETINAFSSKLVGYGYMTVENTLQGSLDVEKERQEINTDLVRKLNKTKLKDTNKINLEVTKNISKGVISRFADTATEGFSTLKNQFGKELNEAGSIKEALAVYKKYANMAFTQSTKNLSKAYNDSKKELEQLTNIINGIANKGAEYTRDNLSKLLTSYENKIAGIIESEREALNESRKILNEVKEDNDAFNDASVSRVFDKNSKLFIAMKEKEIKTLINVKNKITQVRTELSNLPEGTIATDMLRAIRDKVNEIIKTYNTELDKLKTEKEALEEQID
jgi:hypothetical protein